VKVVYGMKLNSCQNMDLFVLTWTAWICFASVCFCGIRVVLARFDIR
jgi:hypothetical protein